MSDAHEQSGNERPIVSAEPAATTEEDTGWTGDDNPERSSRGTRVRGTGRGDTDTDPDANAAPDTNAAPNTNAESSPASPAAADGPVEGDSDQAGVGDGYVEDDAETTLEGEAEIAADYLEELLDIADLDGDIDTYIEGDRAHVSIVTDSDILVGPNGAVLDALQELTRLAVMTETGDRSRLMLDVAGFRDRRRQQLSLLAAAAVERATSSQQPVPLDPMNPFERKIVHDAVAAAGLSSESEGDEPKRHVVVHPKA